MSQLDQRKEQVLIVQANSLFTEIYVPTSQSSFKKPKILRSFVFRRKFGKNSLEKQLNAGLRCTNTPPMQSSANDNPSANGLDFGGKTWFSVCDKRNNCKRREPSDEIKVANSNMA